VNHYSISYPSLIWRLNLLNFLFHSSTVAEILKVPIRLNNDTCLWTPSSNGTVSTKSIHHLHSSTSYHSLSPLLPCSWKSLWKLNINHRLKLFLSIEFLTLCPPPIWTLLVLYVLVLLILFFISFSVALLLVWFGANLFGL